ncbi:HD domain-containing protein [Vibrio natriegens]|uniref:Phosphohydrolase n=1 Tax=Vibrio natriegens NBRC 15636 = ATCC 14048 = DSM 759 TaxID=1219067 RepID=A0AAN1CYE2_VIBNA|nr:HD domain-containing protein [Vibrio natriegens]ALR17593.1 phosphohydrolase [Vibrio natriegens NBRC 15636 = ATCC 14048 = DSM 759]ANQ15083.1 phosphohydrolase [Vibrio natriegens NBRC 15636 = ATCC 14048 = DSM 759]EPM40078.1 phosphohydrolase [Vibrio natriegens NBRC 15636 = ATCC 14048 = DSM 759]MDX6029581.1 HD domain-containing protein [Vibrio natriegens NBRC 15636 = ATCC 14048 = DSM 759]UUI13724.1 HD domain-containing protein [Vibrio natriegens]
MTKHNTPLAGFTHMEHGTAQDWKIIAEQFVDYAGELPDRIIKHLLLLDGDFGGFQVDRLTHSLQCATLAYRDGKDDEYVVCALLHDIGDTLGSYNHPDIAATILEPFVSEENHWMIKHHGIFQGYYFFHHLNMDREMHKAYIDHPCYQRTLEFVRKYDAPAFDPELDTLPLEFFEPMIRKVFERPVRSIYKQAQDKIAAE